MLSFLSNILSGIEHFPTLIVDGLDLVINGLFAAIAAFLTLLFSLLPSMPDAPLVTGGSWVGWMNWFFPVGDLLAGATAILVMYVAYLAIRYALNLIRAL